MNNINKSNIIQITESKVFAAKLKGIANRIENADENELKLMTKSIKTLIPNHIWKVKDNINKLMDKITEKMDSNEDIKKFKELFRKCKVLISKASRGTIKGFKLSALALLKAVKITFKILKQPFVAGKKVYDYIKDEDFKYYKQRDIIKDVAATILYGVAILGSLSAGAFLGLKTAAGMAAVKAWIVMNPVLASILLAVVLLLLLMFMIAYFTDIGNELKFDVDLSGLKL